tara:strand:- start:6854 stop:7396 length:543 start_codon:yes stop_codon:yes gene_type:complete
MTTRLSKDHWLDHGLTQLAAAGPQALKAEPLCKALGVSRGSFYWHFSDLEDFHTQICALWRDRVTEAVIAENRNNSPTDAARLTRLMQAAFGDNSGIEPAMRAWAQENAKVRAVIADVDVRRLTYLAEIIRAAGVPEEQITPRARFVYAAYLGQPFLATAADSRFNADDIDALAALMLVC